ncbi:MAG: glycosyltransferase family 4 protein [Planctomycetota bacterium]
MSQSSRPLRIAYVAYYDPMDISQWSGTGYHMHKAISEAGAEVKLVGPLKKLYHPINAFRYLWNTKVRGYKDHPQRDRGFLRHYARQVEKIVAGMDVDLVLGPGGLPLAYADLDKPMVVWTDATWANLLDYYDAFTNVSPRSIRDGHAGEKALLDRCYRAMFSSQWAADSASEVYGYDPAKVEVVSLGANVPYERTEDEIRAVVESRQTDVLRLLFLGVQWHRKGGDIALAIGEELHKRGLPVRLELVGASPDEGTAVPPFAEALGFIRKSTPEGMARIGRLLDESHFMILPTRADCTPIVFNESSSSGLPVITTTTGGVPSVVREGVNGHLFDIDADPKQWADRIEQLWNDKDAYTELCMKAWRDYCDRLNWRAVGEHAVRFLTQAVEDHRAGKP